MSFSTIKSNYKHKFELWKREDRSCHFKKTIVKNLMSIAGEVPPHLYHRIYLIQASVHQMQAEMKSSRRYIEENLL